MAGIELRRDEGRIEAKEGATSEEAGRGLATWTAETRSLVSADSGACGTTIFWKQVGHSICPPLVIESAVICWPQTGHANLNSLIASTPTISHHGGDDNAFFGSDFRAASPHIGEQRSA